MRLYGYSTVEYRKRYGKELHTKCIYNRQKLTIRNIFFFSTYTSIIFFRKKCDFHIEFDVFDEYYFRCCSYKYMCMWLSDCDIWDNFALPLTIIWGEISQEIICEWGMDNFTFFFNQSYAVSYMDTCINVSNLLTFELK